MSTDTATLEVKPIAINGLKGTYSIISKDLKALPEDAFLKPFGGKTRTVADLIYEVNLVNDHIGMVIRGEEPFVWPEGGWIKAPEGFGTKEEVIAAFDTSFKRILETVEGFTEEQFTEKIKTEDGETTRFERCRFITVHGWYHSGQLNFIQTILGDDVWHWMED